VSDLAVTRIFEVAIDYGYDTGPVQEMIFHAVVAIEIYLVASEHLLYFLPTTRTINCWPDVLAYSFDAKIVPVS
jgi:hypothetical protein